MKTLLFRSPEKSPRPARAARRRASRSLGIALRAAVMLSALVLSGPLPVESAAPPAGTSIGNQASATYTDSSNTERTATSNVAITIVQQVASFTLTTDGQARFAAPGGQVYFPHTLLNTGNGSDTFDLSVANASSGDNFDLNSLALYADANGDGLPDNATAITSSGALAAGAQFQFVAVGIVPASQSASDTAILRVIANGTATASPAASQTNSDTVTVTANAVINVTKAISASSGAAGSGPYTFTLSYNNTGNNTATNVTLLDVIPSGMEYVTNTARWSVTGSTALTDADGDSQGTAPDTIDYDYGETVAGRVTAVIARVQPGQSGTLTFQVNIASGQPAGVINNTPTYSYDPGTGTPVGPFSANTVPFTVTQSTGVSLTGQTIASAPQGGTVVFTNVVQNTGNATDRFDITLTNVSFPAGTTFTLYQSDANTPLVDTSGNGIPDTGPLATNQVYNVIVKAVLPANASGAPFTVIKAATSVTSSSTSDSDSDTLTAVTANTVDLSNGASGGAGAGPEAAPVVVNSANPGVTTRFTLYVTNTSGVADTYNLAASTNSTFATLGLPTGWTVTFRDSSEAIVTATGVILAGTNKQIYADVFVAATNAPGTNSIYFRALSPNSGASDRLHDAVSVNTVRSLSLAPNNTGQATPGGSVVYSHLLLNSGNVLEGDGTVSSVALTLAQSLSGWSAIVYYDANNNGVVDGSDSAVTNLAFVSGSAAGVSPNETIRLLVQVFAPPGAPLGAINTTTLTATTANGTYTTTVPTAVSVLDNTTVVSPDVQLLKEQALDANLDGAPDTAYNSADITAGAIPGRAIRYRITVSNNGTTPATNVKVFDTTPAFTVYTTTGPAATTVGSVTTTPANGAAGALEFNIGTLNPGQSAVVTFGVIITP
jgi:uncharacterized repeat protein (TIGR01451 family)